MQNDLFGQPVLRDVLLREKFIEPPFSILDQKQKSWQARKRLWVSKGIRSEGSREDVVVINNTFGEKYGRGKGMTNEVSIFDPALCELMYRWFCPPGARIFDPFAGGSVRGLVANYLGFKYTGIDLREEQIEANYKNAEEVMPGAVPPEWLIGDSAVKTRELQKDGKLYDMIFSCPPYLDLEVYSDNPYDLSNMAYEDFVSSYFDIIKDSCKLLAPNSFAIFVVGDVRDKAGFYRDFPSITKRGFSLAGVKLYNEAILVQPYGTAMLRANKVYGTNKKLVKVHENVLIFYKGDPSKIREKFNITSEEFDGADAAIIEEVAEDTMQEFNSYPQTITYEERPLEEGNGTTDDKQSDEGDIEPFA